MTIGPGLGLLAAWGAADGPAESRMRRLGLVAAGFLGGLLLVAYPAIFHPGEYWDANVRYQIARQMLSDDGGRGRILVDWLLTGSTLWIAAVAGVIWGRYPGGRGLAIGAVATAVGYVGFLAAATRSAQISYSLAALPCLAYAASGLVEPIRALRPAPRALAWAAFLLVPAVPAATRVFERVTVPDPRVVAARRVRETVPAGSTILVDSWYGPSLRNPWLLLAPYGKVGQDWVGDSGFRESLAARLPEEDRAWTVIPYPAAMPIPDADALKQARVDTVIMSRAMMAREPARAAWESLEKSGTLVPVPPEGPAGVRYFRVAR
jgi:hypothetical protein